MDKTKPPTQTAAPAPAHSRFAIGASIFAASLSSIASIFVISAYMEKNSPPAPTEQAAKSASATAATSDRHDGDFPSAGNHEKLKELLGRLSPEQRELWKSMTAEQRRDLRLKIEADLREAAKNKARR